MKYNYLLLEIDNFLKISGTLEYPEKMHKQINTWAQSVYCEKIYKIVDGMINGRQISPQNLNKAKILKAFLKNKIIENNDNPKNFHLNFDDVSYFTDDEKSIIRENEIKAQFLFIGGNNQASFIAKENKIYIYQEAPLKFSEDTINDILNNISVAIRHELQHALQYYSKFIKDKIIGVPSKSISLNTSKDVPEPLKRTEFYTNLSDSIDLFNECVKILPKKLHREIFEVMIGKNSYYNLKQNVLNLINDIKFSNDNEKQILIRRYKKLLSIIKRTNEDSLMLLNWEPKKHHKYVKELYKEISHFL